MGDPWTAALPTFDEVYKKWTPAWTVPMMQKCKKMIEEIGIELQKNRVKIKIAQNKAGWGEPLQDARRRQNPESDLGGCLSEECDHDSQDLCERTGREHESGQGEDDCPE